MRISAGRIQPLASPLCAVCRSWTPSSMQLCWTWRECPETGGIRHAQKALCDYPCDFETIEVLLSHLSQNPLQCAPDVLCSKSTEDPYLYFLSDEKKVPSGIVDLVTKSKAI